MTTRQGVLHLHGELTLGDLKRLCHNAITHGYTDEARVAFSWRAGGPGATVTVTEEDSASRPAAATRRKEHH